MPLFSDLYGGLYGGLYARADIISRVGAARQAMARALVREQELARRLVGSTNASVDPPASRDRNR